MSINSTIQAQGRLANHIFRNIACHFIAEKNDLRFTYEYKDAINMLGIPLFSGSKVYPESIHINDSNFYDLIQAPPNNKNIILSLYMFYTQTRQYARFLRNYLVSIKDRIIEHNQFNDRYKNNNDLFIHVRLGDLLIIQKNDGRKCYHSFEYYDAICSKLSFDTGYISSDSIDHEICQTLIKKYNLKVYNENEVSTIQFASTCKHIVLSPGTFSWMIGVFGFYSDVYYSMKNIDTWHGDIFVFPDWKVVEF